MRVTNPVPKTKKGFSVEILLKPDSGKDQPVLGQNMMFGGGGRLVVQYTRYCMILPVWKRFYGPRVLPEAEDIVVVRTPSAVKFYVNGRPYSPAGPANAGSTEKPPPVVGAAPMEIGGQQMWKKQWGGYRGVGGFAGWIKLVRVYNAALTAREVASLYRQLPRRGPVR